MGIKESLPEKKFEGVKPVLKEKYEIVSIVEGEKCAVYRVFDRESRKSCLLRSTPIDPDPKKGKKGQISHTQLTQMNSSLMLETKVLEAVYNDTIVLFMDSFVLDHSPTETTKNKKKKKKKNLHRHRCLLMEHCPGPDLETVFKKMMKVDEQKKLENAKFVDPNEPKSSNDDENEDDSVIDKDMTLYWFIKILEGLVEIHKAGLLHGDLQPKHIVVNIRSDRQPEEFRLKVTGFGTDVTKPPPEIDVSGNFIYLSPEQIDFSSKSQSLSQSQSPPPPQQQQQPLPKKKKKRGLFRKKPKIDDVPKEEEEEEEEPKYVFLDPQKTDMWSLGMILLQMFAGVSTEDLVQLIRQRFYGRIKDSEDLSRRVCASCGVEQLEQCKFVELLRFLYSTDELQFTSELLEEYVEDSGVREVLSHMICVDVTKRYTSSQILSHPCVQTWRTLLQDRLFIDQNTNYTFPREYATASEDEKEEIKRLEIQRKSTPSQKITGGFRAISGGGMAISQQLDMMSVFMGDELDDSDDEDDDAKDWETPQDLDNLDLDVRGLLTLMKLPDSVLHEGKKKKKKKKKEKWNRLLCKCVAVLKTWLSLQSSPRKKKWIDDFVRQGRGIETMFEKFSWKKQPDETRKKYLQNVIEAIVLILMMSSPEEEDEEEEGFQEKTMRKIITHFRRFGCTQVLENVILCKDFEEKKSSNQQQQQLEEEEEEGHFGYGLNNEVIKKDKKPDNIVDPSVLYFMYLLTKQSQTILCKLCNHRVVTSLVKRCADDDSLRIYVKCILQIMMSHLGKSELEELLSIYPYNDVTFFKRCRQREYIFDHIIRRLFFRLGELYCQIEEREKGQAQQQAPKKKKTNMMMMEDDDDDSSEEEGDLIECLSGIIFQIQEFDLSFLNQPLKLYFMDGEIPSETRMEISRSNVDDWKLVDIHPLHISCRTKNRKLIEILSQQALLQFKNIKKIRVSEDENIMIQDDEEICIGYYEIDVENGGFTDDLYLGFRVMKTQQPCSILLHAVTGIVGVVDYARKSGMKHMEPTLCETNSTVGCGLTNKGNVFFTKDNRIIQSIQHNSSNFINFLDPDRIYEPIPVHVSVKLNGNFEFKGLLNFGRKRFQFRFQRVLPEVQLTKEERAKIRQMKKVLITEYRGMNKEALKCVSASDPGKLLRNKISKKYEEKNELIYVLLQKIDSLEKYFKDNDFDEDLQEMYAEDTIFEALDAHFQKSLSRKQRNQQMEKEEVEGEDDKNI